MQKVSSKPDIYPKVDYTNRFRILRKLFFPFLLGILFIAVALIFQEQSFGMALGIFGALLALPVFVYSYVLVILHWKDRYIGDNSTLWGVLILVETSGWMKLVYIFRHLIPEMREQGRYKIEQDDASNLQ